MLSKSERSAKRRAIEKIFEMRRTNVRYLCGYYFDSSWAEFARYIAVSPQFLNQLAGPNPVRSISEKTARDIERKMRLPTFYLDQKHNFKN